MRTGTPCGRPIGSASSLPCGVCWPTAPPWPTWRPASPSAAKTPADGWPGNANTRCGPRLLPEQRDKLTGIGVEPLPVPAPRKAMNARTGALGAFERGIAALRQYKARTGSVTVPRGHIEALTGASEGGARGRERTREAGGLDLEHENPTRQAHHRPARTTRRTRTPLGIARFCATQEAVRRIAGRPPARVSGGRRTQRTNAHTARAHPEEEMIDEMGMRSAREGTVSRASADRPGTLTPLTSPFSPTDRPPPFRCPHPASRPPPAHL